MHCRFAYPVCMFEIDTIVLNCRQNRVASVRLHLLAGTSGMIVFSRHLREQTITKSERRESEAPEFVTLEQFGVDRSTGNHNFCAPHPNSLDFSSFFQRESCEHLRNAPHLQAI